MKEHNENFCVWLLNGHSWEKVPAVNLSIGSIIYHQNMTLEVTNKPELIDGKINLPVKKLNNQIIIHLGDAPPGRKFISQVIDLTNCGCLDLPDGTSMITEHENGLMRTYSPRLPTHELDAFCRENLSRYSAFYEANQEKIEHGVLVKMEQWW